MTLQAKSRHTGGFFRIGRNNGCRTDAEWIYRLYGRRTQEMKEDE